MLRDRQQSILGAAIREHIRTAKPVASEDLVRALKLRVSPATIRNEMLALDRSGYLEQPHTSAGRIPTDKGYRFFVNHLVEEHGVSDEAVTLIKRVFGETSEEEFVRELSTTVSRLSGNFSAAGLFEDDVFYLAGFSRIFGEPEFQDLESVRVFGRLMDVLDEEVRRIFDELDIEEEAIFIGEENPLPEARSSTMLLGTWKHPRGFRGFVTLVGPKRMNYAKNISLLEYLLEYGR